MKVGLGVMAVPPLAIADQMVFEAEQAELDAVFVPDRIMSWFPKALWPEVGNVASMLPSPHAFLDPFTTMAAWAQHTDNIRFVTAVSDPVRVAPAQLAVKALTMSLLTQGRFVLGLGCGEAANLTPYGLDSNRLVSRFDEALQVIRSMWEQDDPHFDGRHWSIDHAVLDIAPFHDAYPEIWIGAHGPRMLEITGRLGDGWLPFMPFDPDEYAQRLAVVRSSAERAGRDPMSIVAGLNTPICLADTHEEAHAMMATSAAKQFLLVLPEEFWSALGLKHPLGLGTTVLEYIPEALTEAELRAAMDSLPDPLIAHDYFIHGTVEEVAAKIRQYQDAGLQYFAPLDTAPLTNMALMPGSVERVARLRDLLAEGNNDSK